MKESYGFFFLWFRYYNRIFLKCFADYIVFFDSSKLENIVGFNRKLKRSSKLVCLGFMRFGFGLIVY